MLKFWYAIGLLVGLCALVILQSPSQNFRLIACDVGQGDGIVIMKGDVQIIVDGGPSGERMLSCLEKHIPFWDRRIELIVLTNTDYDHMNGLSAVVERYKVMQFVTSDGVHKSVALDKMIAKLSEYDISVVGVEQGDIIKVEGESAIVLNVLWPPEVNEEYVAVFTDQINKDKREQILGASAKRGDLNERSVVLEILEDGKRYLLMGDAGFQAEEQLIKSGRLSDVDYLKVGHHGSKYATSQEFLKIVRPEIALISVGTNNRYGHPTSEALQRLSLSGARIQRTDLEGDLIIN
ncbi:MAG: MBL fold metallo-hydrolase [Candidatus Moraniibacteriota bacterium]|nr:MAG: MBL fold metallo-hydrolase [Candidatus Moranbacteria bacterium]